MSAIDISRYQGVVNFNAVKAAGVGVVIAKLGGGDAGQYLDAMWAANRNGIRAAGLLLGSYYFNGPGSSPTAAADFHIANADWRSGELLIIDVEGSGIAWSPDQVFEWVNRILQHGVPASHIGVYMSASVVRAYNWAPVSALGVFLWAASYGANTGTPGTPPAIAHWSSWSLWQYTSNGSIPGVPGRVDVSQLAPGWSGDTVTPLEDEVAYTLIAANDVPLLNTVVYDGPFGPFVLSGNPQDALAQKQSIAAWNGVGEADVEAAIKPMSSVAVQNAINTFKPAATQVVNGPAVDLGAVTARLDDLASTLTKGYTFNVKPA